MFLVRDTQVRAFEQIALTEFEDEMVRHCRESSPHRCRLLSEAALRRAIQGALEGASRHGFTHRGPARLYVDLTFLLGSGFDSDPQVPWAAEALGEAGLGQSYRAEALHREVCAYLEEIGGEEPARTRRSLERLAALAGGEGLARAGSLAEDALLRMAEMHPEKVARVGEAPLRQLVDRAGERVEAAWGAREPRTVALVSGLMFVFGHRCDEDPVHPWIEAMLGAREERGDAEPGRVAGELWRVAALWGDDGAGDTREEQR
ncbi:hypothetical protein [Chondromyces apiculatus]|uniref:Uncharacterized protein n=1 Tax=Chondromyces apiculatus DSM 436 TaxID=1192034 RepID=A0A017TA97_9BACT|nr:hypothetical protein [Chondromyces apiculatus]EYF06144.1 Hypothetical protein CAP_2334 [Chondromyces apiculatus DSM 436]